MKVKRILIPTDFSVGSLNVLKTVLSSNVNGHVYDVVLLHGITRSDDIRDLLFTSNHRLLQSVCNPDFEEAVKIIKNKYASSIRSIRNDAFTGYNQTAFNNYIEGNKIDEAYVSTTYTARMGHKSSFDVTAFICKSSLKVNGVEWASQQETPEKGQIAEILLNSASAA